MLPATIALLPAFHLPAIVAAVLILTGLAFSLLRKKLTIPAAITGAVAGTLLYWGGGLTALCLMTLFFILGTAATSWKKASKQHSRARDSHQTRRNAGQVLANAGVAGALAAMACGFPAYQPVLLLMIAGSFSAATADTLSSELGMVYGRRFYHILHWRQEEKGLDGLISLEGTLCGAAGSALIALAYAAGTRFTPASFVILVVAGTAGNLADSLLGATLERRDIIGNDLVNLLNTATGAAVAGLLWLL